MRAAGEVAGALQESEPNLRVLQRMTDLQGGPPLTQVVCAKMNEAEASQAFDKARGLEEGRRTRNGCQGQSPGAILTAIHDGAEGRRSCLH